MTDETIPAKDLALRLGVTPESVRRWAKQGRLRSIRHGRRYSIPLIEAELFVAEYERVLGEQLSPDIPQRSKFYRVRTRPPSVPHGRSSLYVTVQTAMLHMVDDERREELAKTDQRISRSEFVEAAIGYYVNARKNERLNAKRKKVAS